MRTRRKKCLFLSCFLLSATLFAGCSGQTDKQAAEKIEGLDKLGTIRVITREEGSGTRSVFAEKTNLENRDKNSDTDNIRTDAEIAMNADAVMERVAEDENAIGYISLGAVTADMDQVKIIGIDGVKPEKSSISKGSYPLVRNINIAYSGKLNNAGNDFLGYILSAGQEIVGEKYTSVKKVNSFLSDQSKGTLTISGSSSATPLLEELAEAYNQKYNKNVKIQIQTSDSTSGLTSAMQGSSDWGVSSRELKDYEKELLSYQNIAKDGVAVIVNQNNPTDTLTLWQLTEIFDGTDTVWKEVNE